jgi:hypothetical protein
MKQPSSRKTKGRGDTTAPSREEIAQRAFELFLQRGGEPGHEQQDWLQAEKNLREEKAQPS